MSTESLTAVHGHIATLFDNVGSRVGLSEIMVNPDCTVWIERSGVVSKTKYFQPEEKTYSLIKMLAGINNLICDAEHPTLAVRIPEELAGLLDVPGGRIQAILPPLTTGPTLCIRVPSRIKPSIEELTSRGIFASLAKQTKKSETKILHELKSYVKNKKNIMLTGGTGSGKTTLGNALLDLITDERVIIIEDMSELSIRNSNTVYILTNENYSARDAVFTSLRFRPDRIVLGELRDGPTAVELCNAFVTGHRGGQVTFHADSCIQGLRRLRSLMLQAANNISSDTVLDAIDIVIHITKQYKDDGSFIRIVDEIFPVEENRNKVFMEGTNV
jgi:type IV secretion system protein VirB11